MAKTQDSSLQPITQPASPGTAASTPHPAAASKATRLRRATPRIPAWVWISVILVGAGAVIATLAFVAPSFVWKSAKSFTAPTQTAPAAPSAAKMQEKGTPQNPISIGEMVKGRFVWSDSGKHIKVPFGKSFQVLRVIGNSNENHTEMVCALSKVESAAGGGDAIPAGSPPSPNHAEIIFRVRNLGLITGAAPGVKDAFITELKSDKPDKLSKEYIIAISDEYRGRALELWKQGKLAWENFNEGEAGPLVIVCDGSILMVSKCHGTQGIEFDEQNMNP